MKNPLFVALVSSMLVFCAVSSEAAERYVRAGATGSNNGTDWTNAYTSLPASLVRGDVYYVADGNYPGYIFNDPVSGNLSITIKKATVADHGTDTGWNNSYGDGACPASPCVQFTGGLTFITANWVLDGQTGGGPGQWTQGFGFQVTETADTRAMLRVDNDTADNLIIRHIRLIGKGAPGGGGSLANDCMAVFGASNVTLSYYYMSGCGRCPFFLSATNFIAEYGYTGRFFGTDAAHSELASVWNFAGPRPSKIVFRHNLFTYTESTGGLIFDATNVEVYGNVFWQDPALPRWAFPNGVIGSWTVSSMTNSFVYNNSFVNLTDSAFGLPVFGQQGAKTGTVAQNNLFYNVPNPGSNSWPTFSYNHYVSSTPTGTNPSTASNDPFVSISGLNFGLKATTPAGYTLQPPYNIDMSGRVRGADTIWDRGALEYVTQSGTTLPNAPTNLRVQ